MTYAYDAGQHGLCRTALQVSHTVWPMVFRSVVFWLFVAINLVTHYCYRYSYFDTESFGGSFHLSWTNVQVISAITTFFEVFYTSQSYQRYLLMHHELNEAFRAAHRLIFEVKYWAQGAGIEYFRLVTRYTRVSMFLFIFELKNGAASDEHLLRLMEFGMLRTEEHDLLRSLSSAQRQLKLLELSAGTIRLLNEVHPINPPALCSIVGRAADASESQKHVLDAQRMPVPFQYFHILNIMVVINLLLWAYGMAATNSIFGPIAFFFASFIFIGMLKLANAIANPFGSDEVDFPVWIWFEKFLENQMVFTDGNSSFPEAKLKAILKLEGIPSFHPEELSAFIQNPESFPARSSSSYPAGAFHSSYHAGYAPVPTSLSGVSH